MSSVFLHFLHFFTLSYRQAHRERNIRLYTLNIFLFNGGCMAVVVGGGHKVAHPQRQPPDHAKPLFLCNTLTLHG